MTEELKPIEYSRHGFQASLPTEPLYTQNHYWFVQKPEGLVRCGFSPLVMRLMGDTVDFEINVSPGEAVEEYFSIGSIEAFKAVNDLYSPMSGIFVRHNPDLEHRLELLLDDPTGAGWLYEIKGEIPFHAMSVHEYVRKLDQCLDELKAGRES